ncbi:class I SAM-dependent methyltransferase [Streptomyces sp. NPDC020379]|uniref:class I SAM-dependent methyltransferase n=1 Tax=Streptomyces sp. NPDC020379 TaxID=3365071 RepID=UPI00379C1A69
MRKDPAAGRDVAQFERWAATYDDSVLQERYFRPVQRALLHHAAVVEPDPPRILDIGCGTGALLRQARARFPRAAVTGADPAHSMIRRAAADGGACVVGRAEQLPFPDASFPLVLSTLSFHHWADQRRGLAEAARVLRPGGHVLIADHFATGWLRAVFAAVGKRGRMRTHAEAEAMLRTAGLTPLGWHIALTVTGFLRAAEGSGPLPLAALCVARKPSAG